MSSNGDKSLRDRILATKDIPERIVPVPQWGVDVLVKGMSGAERAQYMKLFRNDDGTLNYEAMYPSLLIATVHDPDHPDDKVFMAGDEVLINQKAGAALEIVAQAALELSGMGKESEAEAGNDSSRVESGSTTS